MPIPILMYHSINTEKNNVSLNINNFRKQMFFLKKNNFQTINLNQINNKNSNKKNFIITFDDGYEDVYLNALPILKELNFSAICYFVTNFIGKYNFWDENKSNYKKMKLMNLTQIKSWIHEGMQVGAHTSNHIDLSNCEYNQKKNEIIDPIFFFKKNLSIDIENFSYPFGKFDSQTTNIVKDYYKTAVTTQRSRYKFNKFNFYNIPRVPINNSTNLLKFWLKIYTPYEDIKFR